MLQAQVPELQPVVSGAAEVQRWGCLRGATLVFSDAGDGCKGAATVTLVFSDLATAARVPLRGDSFLL
jgi:hypothetical protein